MITLEDSTGAIIISVAQGGTSGFMPVGQEVLVSLKGLYIGGYRKQAQVGAVYTSASNGSLGIGRMNRRVGQPLQDNRHGRSGSADSYRV